MVSPREKRVWPPQDKDSDGETVAAFEAAVAVVKETVVRSGEVLVSAKEDLSDHQRWLKVQIAAVEADRERHDRWLHRQRKRQEAIARREHKRARRRAMRQAAVDSVKNTVSAGAFAVLSAFGFLAAKTIAGLNYVDALAASGAVLVGTWLRNTVSAGAFAVLSAFGFLAAKTIAGLNYIDTVAASGAVLVGTRLRNTVSAGAFAVLSAFGFLAAKTIAGLNYIDTVAASAAVLVGTRLRDLMLTLSRAIWYGLSFTGRKASSLASSVGALLLAVIAAIGAKINVLAPSVGNFLLIWFGGLAARARDASRAMGKWLGTSFSWLSAKAETLTQSVGETLAPAFASIAARAHALAPSLTGGIAKAGLAVGDYARGGALRVRGLLARANAPRVDAENAVSSPPRIRGFDLSQMLIIAGALLLVLGGLMLGGGLLLRASTPTEIFAESPSEPLAWPFEHKGLPIDERSVFLFAATPDGVRINGFAIGGVNLSDQPIASLGGAIKPDLQAQDLKLALSVEAPGEHAGEAQLFQEGVIPPQAPFKFVFHFPERTANGGMTPQEVLADYGGLMLKVHYEMAGTQRSFIQYLPPALLQEQLDEIQAAAKGS